MTSTQASDVQEAHPSIAPGILSLFNGIVQHNTAGAEPQAMSTQEMAGRASMPGNLAAIGTQQASTAANDQQHSNISQHQVAEQVHSRLFASSTQPALHDYSYSHGTPPAQNGANTHIWAHAAGQQHDVQLASGSRPEMMHPPQQAHAAAQMHMHLQQQRHEHHQQPHWQRQQQHARLPVQQQAPPQRQVQMHDALPAHLQRSIPVQPVQSQTYAAQHGVSPALRPHLMMPKQPPTQQAHAMAPFSAGWVGTGQSRNAPPWPQPGADHGYGQWRGQRS